MYKYVQFEINPFNLMLMEHFDGNMTERVHFASKFKILGCKLFEFRVTISMCFRNIVLGCKVPLTQWITGKQIIYGRCSL